MTRVIHTGDTHVGYRQYHSAERRRDFLDAFRAVVDDAIADDVDAVVHAGDLFHDRRPGLRDLLGTIDVLRPLADADIPFLAVVGNHEGTRDAQWLDLFQTLDLAERLDATGRVVGDTTFYGLDYVPESKRPQLDYQFADPETEHAALVSHGLFQPFPHGDWDLEAILDETNVDFDAVLLGDNHAADTVDIAGTWATYCGSTERASASERDPRGYNIVEFAEETNISRRGLDTRDFVFVDLDLAGDEGTEFVRDRVREHDLEDAVVVVTIEGEGSTVTPAEVETLGDDLGALVTRVNDRREFDETDDVEVSFADPDDAVRERVRDLDLSPAARGIDETVRESKVADSNVRDTVKDRVKALVADDPGAFDRADPGEETDAEIDERRETDEHAEPDDRDDGRDDADQTDADAEETVSDNEEATSSDETTPHEASPDETGPDESAEGESRADDVTTMGDFL
ncbi:DNA double-strand break repair protein Mre11 [Halocalculus aciditolerans]|uniref:DNA double-strand break repair protein Mre11 n=1 Tax=Halocalculus aciditolerans TaxID=1383812 RepID=A0A830F4H8_9EURY|nr:DNA double-strand break repair protein Mre11 [Halocalculus aciditolerans]GGL61863.1 metallophosphatase [Halocalculus aciditolerans]